MATKQITDEEYSEYQQLKGAALDKLLTEYNDVQRTKLKFQLHGNLRFENNQLVPYVDGAPVHDAHGWPVTADQYVKDLANDLFKVTEPEVKPPTNGLELYEQMKAATTSEERRAIFKSYKGS
jgi:hypothetical protein